MKLTISHSELEKFRFDIEHCNIDIFLDFASTLDYYEKGILKTFLSHNNEDICYTLLLIIDKFYLFVKERNIL